MIPQRQLLIDLALAEVGVREEGGNNRGKRIQEYQAATWLAPAAWPWCAALCAWLLREWTKESTVRSLLGLANPTAANAWRCKSAGAFDWENWFKNKGYLVLPEGSRALAGDFVTFDFSHIGLVVEDQKDRSVIVTVEGNTNGKGERDSTSGDGVWRKRRPASVPGVDGIVRHFLRIPALHPAENTPSTVGEPDTSRSLRG